MRKLTNEEIDMLVERPKVKKVAVENFLMTVQENKSFPAAVINLYNDAKSYRWNKPTIEAIEEGILISANL